MRGKSKNKTPGSPALAVGRKCWATAVALRGWLAVATLVCMSLQMKHSLNACSRSLAMGEEKRKGLTFAESCIFSSFHLSPKSWYMWQTS